MSDFGLALRQNIATNGRWFCALMFTLALSTGHLIYALAFALVVGASCIGERLPGRFAALASFAIYLFAASTAALLAISLIW